VSARKHAAAEPLLRQALEIVENALGKHQLACGSILANWGMCRYDRGDYVAAEPLLRRAAEVKRAVLGEQHPDYARSLSQLACLFASTGGASAALTLLQRATAIDEQVIGQAFAIGVEQHRMALLQAVQENTHKLLSHVLQHLSCSGPAVRTALDVVLRRKALAAEMLCAQRDVAVVLGGRYPALKPRLHELAELRMQIAESTLAGPGPEGLRDHEQLLEGWHARKDQLERKLARQIPVLQLKQRLRQADHQTVAQACPGTAWWWSSFAFPSTISGAHPLGGEVVGGRLATPPLSSLPESPKASAFLTWAKRNPLTAWWPTSGRRS
jgi:hypothetical protein